MRRKHPLALASMLGALLAALAALLALLLAGAAPQAPAQTTLPTLSIDDVMVSEGNSGTTNATFTITLLEASMSEVTVRYATTNGTAVQPADYVAVTTPSTVTIPAGQTTTTATVAVKGDPLDEIDEIFQVQLSAPTNATINDGIGVATIVDDDLPPTLSVNDPSFSETNNTSTNRFTVSLSAASGKTITVRYDITGTATAGTDFTSPTTGTLTFSATPTTPTVTTQPLPITVVADTVDELNETLVLTLSDATNATIAKPTGTATIIDDDVPTISIDDISVPEGDSGTTDATFTVRLSAASPQDVSVRVVSSTSTSDTPAAVAPGDYTLLASTLVTILAGQTTATVSVAVVGETVDEADERFRVSLLSPVNSTIGDGIAIATIVDDDPPPAMRIEDLTINEGSVGATNAVLKVTLNAPSGRTIIAAATTTNGTATAGVDYGETTELLTFNAGQVERTITIPIGPDGAVENDETFTVAISPTSPAANQTLDKGVATVTIVDDDLGPGNTPSLSVADAQVAAEGDSGTKPVTITVRLSTAPGRTVGVSYATVDGSATAPADYAPLSGRLEFLPGQQVKTIETTIVGDTAVEGHHSFKVRLSEPANATIGDGEATVLITDDDVGAGPVTAPATVDAKRLLCATRRGCSGLPVGWTVYARGTLVFELAAVAPRRTIAAKGSRPRRTIAAKVIPILKTTSTITRPRSGRRVLRPTPGRDARRLLSRLRRDRATSLRLKVTFVNRSGDAKTTTLRIRLNLKR